MKFVLYVEGYTEKKAISAFLKRWLDPRLRQPVGIKPVRFEGWAELVHDVPKKAALYLHGHLSGDTIAVIALMDLYEPDIYPRRLTRAEDRRDWAVKEIEKKVNEDRFKMFFAVHEVEAWVLSDPGLFELPVAKGFPGKVQHPESVNFDEPPSRLLERFYEQKLKKAYKKVTDGSDLFSRLDPDLVYQKCKF